MSARIFRLDEYNIDYSAINECAALLKNGGLAIFPTETVYGIGANAFDEKAVLSLYEKKQRPLSKPLLMHVSGLEMAESVGILDETARELIKRFTPGPLTLVVKKKPNVPSVAVSGGDTVGLRFPSNKIFLALSNSFSAPIAATSANISGFKSVSSASELDNVTSVADIILDGGECEYGLESTIVSLVNKKPEILRYGSFPKETLEEVLGL